MEYLLQAVVFVLIQLELHQQLLGQVLKHLLELHLDQVDQVDQVDQAQVHLQVMQIQKLFQFHLRVELLKLWKCQAREIAQVAMMVGVEV
jgi:hypothetical protein